MRLSHQCNFVLTDPLNIFNLFPTLHGLEKSQAKKSDLDLAPIVCYSSILKLKSRIAIKNPSTSYATILKDFLNSGHRLRVIEFKNQSINFRTPGI